MIGSTEQRRATDNRSFRSRLRVWWRNHGYRDMWMLMLTAIMLAGVVTVENLANDSRDSLCALRADLERRSETTMKLLSDHPNGIPGIPAAVLRKSISDQRRTIVALHGLDCSQAR